MTQSKPQFIFTPNPNFLLNNSQTVFKPSKVPPIGFIKSKRPSFKWNGDPIFIITEIGLHDKDHLSSKYLDQSIFKQDESGAFTANNPIINTYDCNPEFLLTLADRLAAGDLPYPDAIRTQVINSIRDVFLNKATPRMLHDSIYEHATIIFKDDEYPETYRLDGELFFRSMSNRTILAFDIHDLVHHPLQMIAWPEQFQFITQTALWACELPKDDKKGIRMRELTGLIWLACFEESLITLNDHFVSFGCLNWLSPSETPLDKKPALRTLSIQDQKIAFRWHYLDAFKDMYRIAMKSSQLIGEDLKWIEKLGYSIDDTLRQMIESDVPRPFENLDYNDALKFYIQAPKSPEELFANAINLLREEV